MRGQLYAYDMWKVEVEIILGGGNAVFTNGVYQSTVERDVVRESASTGSGQGSGRLSEE